MSERMDRLVVAATRQGFHVWQTKRGSWVFRRGTLTVTETSTPETPQQWLRLLVALRAAELVFPPD